MAAERDKDDIAAALHGLSADDSTAEHAGEAHLDDVREPSPAPPPRISAPQRPSGRTLVPGGSSGASHAPPSKQRPATPVSPASPPTGQPAASTPRRPAASPMPRPVTPAAPTGP